LFADKKRRKDELEVVHNAAFDALAKLNEREAKVRPKRKLPPPKTSGSAPATPSKKAKNARKPLNKSAGTPTTTPTTPSNVSHAHVLPPAVAAEVIAIRAELKSVKESERRYMMEHARAAGEIEQLKLRLQEKDNQIEWLRDRLDK
jgi:hypothetical protein